MGVLHLAGQSSLASPSVSPFSLSPSCSLHVHMHEICVSMCVTGTVCVCVWGRFSPPPCFCVCVCVCWWHGHVGGWVCESTLGCAQYVWICDVGASMTPTGAGVGLPVPDVDSSCCRVVCINPPVMDWRTEWAFFCDCVCVCVCVCVFVCVAAAPGHDCSALSREWKRCKLFPRLHSEEHRCFERAMRLH